MTAGTVLQRWDFADGKDDRNIQVEPKVCDESNGNGKDEVSYESNENVNTSNNISYEAKSGKDDRKPSEPAMKLRQAAYIDYAQLEVVLRDGNDAEFFDLLDAQIRGVRKEIDFDLEQVNSKRCCTLAVGSVTLTATNSRKTTRQFVDALFECIEFDREAVATIMIQFDAKYPALAPRQRERLAMFDLVLEDTMDAVEAFGTKARISSGSSTGKYKCATVFAIVSVMMIIFAIAQSPKLAIVFGIAMIFGFLTAMGNAANDICNAVGTAAGCGALTLAQAVIFGCIFEGIGCFTMGPFVSKSITKGMIMTEQFEDSPELFAFAMMCVLIGEPTITLLATAYGFPISATHGIIGGIVAVGLVAKGPDAIGWERLGLVCAGWVVAPVCGALVALFMYGIIQVTVFNSKEPAKRASMLQAFFLWICASVNLLFIFIKGPKVMRIKPIGMAILVACGVGVGITVVVYPLILWRSKPRKNSPSWMKWPPIALKINRMLGLDEDLVALQQAVGRKLSFRSYQEVQVVEEDPEIKKAESKFVPLLVISAFSVATAHGGNDVGNAVGPLSAVLAVYTSGEVQEKPDIPYWAIAYGAAGFMFGIILMGKHTIKTVGTQITKLSPAKSFSTQMGGAVAVLAASSMGMPVSTSHCLVGAVVGMGVAQRIAGKGSLNLKVLTRIFIAWGVTIPSACFVTLCVFLPFNHFFRN